MGGRERMGAEFLMFSRERNSGDTAENDLIDLLCDLFLVKCYLYFYSQSSHLISFVSPIQ